MIMNINLSIHERWGVLVALFPVVFASLFSQVAVCHGSSKKPMVAILTINSTDKEYSYVGPALTHMLDTRLSSEGIDCFVVASAQGQSEEVKLSDFLVTGQVVKGDNTFDAEIFLKEPGSDEVLKSWHLKAVSLDALAQNVALFSVKLADTIKHAEDILIEGPGVAEGPGEAQGNPESDEFKMARMHPDKLVREQLVKDEEKERELERQKTQEQKRIERQQALAQKKEPEEWFPIADVYDPDTDELPKAEPQEQPSVNGTVEAGKQNVSAPPPEGGQGERSWLSWLWPFGKKDKIEEQQEWEKEREELRAEQIKNEHAAKVVPEDALPYPPPPQIQFNIPEPVPTDQALKKIDEMYVSKPLPREKEEGWLSRLWPWGNEGHEPAIPERSAQEQESVQARIQPSEEIHRGLGSMVDTVSGKVATGPQEDEIKKEEASSNKAKKGFEGQGEQTDQVEGTTSLEESRGTKDSGWGQRQEHVYFGPRPRPETGQEEIGGTQSEEEGPSSAASEAQKTVETEMDTSFRFDTGAKEEVGQKGPEGQLRAEASSEGGTTDNTEDRSEATHRPQDLNGPIWRWY